ncbi:ZP3 protein, partial [Polyodon spathula]|nr:ZP3 protein [Polyodon spathula]
MLSPRESDGDTHATLPPEIKRIMSLGSVDKSPTTPAVSDVAVLCGESHMVVKVKKRFFGFGCTASQLSLGYNYECQSNGVDRKTGDIVFTYSQSACGSKRSMPDGLVVYQNILRYVPNRRRSSIRRTHPLNIEIECRYPSSSVFCCTIISPLSSLAKPNVCVSLSLIVSCAPLSLGAWTKGSLSNVYQLGQVINFQARGYPRKPGQKIFIHSCHATASPDSNSTPQYNVIDNYGCMVDSKIEASNSSFVPPRTRDTINFVVDAFQFNVKPSSKVFIVIGVNPAF